MCVQVTEKPYTFLKGTSELHMIGAFKGRTDTIKIKMQSIWTVRKKNMSDFQKDNSRGNPSTIFHGF